MAIEIRHEADRLRFVAEVEGSEAFVQYGRPDAATIDLFRTWTPDALRGRGLAGQLVEAALEYARAENLRVVPTCPYVARFIEEHGEYQALVAD